MAPEAPAGNLTERGRAFRLRVGLAWGAVGLVLLAALVASGAPRVSRLLVLPAFWSAALGFFQHREKT